MSSLSNIEKLKIEKLFGMASGYVLDFSNRTFQEFIFDSLGIDIYSEKYDYASGSKANRLRAFWNAEPDYLVATVLDDLLEYWKTTKTLNLEEISGPEKALFEDCENIVERLGSAGGAAPADLIRPNTSDRDFSRLAQSVRESINRNEPELALDRLHTFTVKYIRHLCDRHGIPYDRGIPLHGLFGMYVKQLRRDSRLESEMSERILKSSMSILESFNKVRNESSFAHDNPLLNHEEALLIFNNVAASIRFLEAMEEDAFDLTNSEGDDESDFEIPFWIRLA